MGATPSSVPIWSFAKRVDRRGHEDAELLSVYRDYGVVPKASRDDNFNKESEDLSNYLYVEEGDLVLNNMKTWQGSLAVSKFEGIVSPAYFVCKLGHHVVPRYVHYLLRSDPLIAEYAKRSKGIRPNQWDLPFDEFKGIEVALPPVEEQRRIADFLDAQVATVERASAEVLRWLSLSAEYEQTLEHIRVTGQVPVGRDGVDKASGLEWQTNPPPGWKSLGLSSVFSLSKGKEAQRLTREYVLDHPGDFPVFSGQTANSGHFGMIDTYDFDLPSGGILVSTVGAAAMTTRLVWGRLSLSQNCALMIPRSQIPQSHLYFIECQLRSIMKVKRSEIPDHMQPSLRLADLAGYRILMPPEAMIDAVVRELQDCSQVLADARLCRQQQLTLLEELRGAIITAAVTGELEVTTARPIGVGGWKPTDGASVGGTSQSQRNSVGVLA